MRISVQSVILRSHQGGTPKSGGTHSRRDMMLMCRDDVVGENSEFNHMFIGAEPLPRHTPPTAAVVPATAAGDDAVAVPSPANTDATPSLLHPKPVNGAYEEDDIGHRVRRSAHAAIVGSTGNPQDAALQISTTAEAAAQGRKSSVHLENGEDFRLPAGIEASERYGLFACCL